MLLRSDASAKTLFWYLLNASLFVVIVFGLIGVGTLIQYSNSIAPSRTIYVTGEGKVTVEPDLATVTTSVTARGKDASAVQAEATRKMNSVIAFIKSQGIPAADIQTTAFSLYPTSRWDPKTGESIVTGSESTQSVTVKIRGVGGLKEKASAVAAGLADAGANQIAGMSFEVSDPELLRSAARAKAFASAYEKAASMAAQNGVRISRVVTFSENQNNPGPIYYDRAMATMGKGGEATPPTPSIEPGSQEIGVTVTVTYEIK